MVTMTKRAFPRGDWREPGMTLRDYFAGQALIGILAAGRVDVDASETARVCHNLADAMLAEREKRNMDAIDEEGEDD